MGDLALEWGNGSADLALADDDLETDEGLRTAVLLSLFIDRRAEDDDDLPAADGDKRGWWGDEFAEVVGDRIGSRLWLLDRSKRIQDVISLAEEYDREGLAWMIEDRIAERIDIAATLEDEMLIHTIAIYRPATDPVTFQFAHAWDGEAARAI